jgi:hypothetical protein
MVQSAYAAATAALTELEKTLTVSTSKVASAVVQFPEGLTGHVGHTGDEKDTWSDNALLLYSNLQAAAQNCRLMLDLL